MKRIAVFGGTGLTGALFCRKALEHGHELAIYARNPSKLPNEVATQSSVKIIKGEIDDGAQMATAIEDQDLIVSFLGPTEFWPSTPPELYVQAYKTIFDTMRKQKVKVIYAIGTPYTPDTKDSNSHIARFASFFFRIFSHNLWKSFVLIGNLFDREAEDLSWTIVRVGRLSDGANRKTTAFEYVGAPGWTSNTTRDGIAEWIVNQIDRDDQNWIHKKPAVSTSK